MAAKVLKLRGGAGDVASVAAAALVRFQAHIHRAALSEHTVRAYGRHGAGYVAWVGAHAGAHPDAFGDVVGAEAAVNAWRTRLVRAGRQAPSSVNQALAAVVLLYEVGAHLVIKVKRGRTLRPGEPVALTKAQQGAVERAAARRSPRDQAIISVLLYTGARCAETAGLDLADVAVTERTGKVRLYGKGGQAREVDLTQPVRAALRAWLLERGAEPGRLWVGQRGPLTTSGIVAVTRAVGREAGLVEELRPHRLRHTFATRCRQGGMDQAVLQYLMGHASAETTARYWRAGAAEAAEALERVFGD